MKHGSALFVVVALLGTFEYSPATAQDDLARELPRIRPLEPAAALASFRIHEGFRLEPVAVEPLVTDPVSVCYDADGRLYVAEMRGYPFPEKTPTGNITRLEDRDGDGRFEGRTVFVDGLSWPTGIVPYDDGVFIAVAPDILYAKDTNGDGVADVKTVMFTGFGTENVQGLLNGLLWGPDGWIYGVTSSNGGEIRSPSNPSAKPVSVRGRDFRFRPDGSSFEAISGGGQFGHSFDDWGHRFTCNNSNHIRQIVLPSRELERNPALLPPAVLLDIPAEGAAAPVFRISPPEPWRVVRTRQRVSDPEMRKRLPPTEFFAFGFFTSATGVTIYRGSAYPEQYRGNVFVGDAGGNLVHRKFLSVRGSTYLATRADRDVEFLASTDNWFRPVNFANTPDGTLLIVDMYRETIEHPWSIPEPIQKHLDLTSGRDRGRLYNLVADGASRHRSPRLGRALTAELVAPLADSDAWWRETAQRLLIERRDASAVPLLKEMASRRPTALGRMHALWTLDTLDSLDSKALIPGLEDPEPRVREQSAKLAERRIARDADLLAKLLTLADDPDPMVRFQVALSLGDSHDDPRVIPALASIAVRDAADIWTRTAVLSSIPGKSSDMIEALAARSKGFFETDPGRSCLDELAIMVGAGRDESGIGRLIGRLVVSGADSRLLTRVVLAVGRGLKRSGGSPAGLRGGPASGRIGKLLEEAAQVAPGDGPIDRRLPAIALLAMLEPTRAITILPGLLDSRQPGQVQLAALQGLGGLSDPSVGALVLSQWRSMSPTVRREAAEVLFARRDRLDSLLSAIESKALAPADIDPDRARQLRMHKDPQVRSRAVKVLGAESASPRDRLAVLDSFRTALALAGRPENGKAVFIKTCSTCHRAFGQGTDVAPDLATVTGRSPEDLLMHILDPNREVAPNYMNYNVATTDGRVVSGIIASESATALTLRRAEGATDVVPRSQIETVASTGLSLMPEGLEKGLSAQDLADLIAFLKTIPAGTPAGINPTR
jgi:putative membrane-bound dehydrogenase-like protein